MYTTSSTTMTSVPDTNPNPQWLTLTRILTPILMSYFLTAVKFIVTRPNTHHICYAGLWSRSRHLVFPATYANCHVITGLLLIALHCAHNISVASTHSIVYIILFNNNTHTYSTCTRTTAVYVAFCTSQSCFLSPHFLLSKRVVA